MKKELLAAAIASTMLMGAKAMADNHGGDSKESQKQHKKKSGCEGKDGCKGKNGCEGKSGCEGKDGCEGKKKKKGDSCSGPGGCPGKE